MKFIRSLFKGRERRGLCGSPNYGVATKPTTTTLSPGIPGASRKRCFVEDKDGNRVEFIRGKHRYY